VSVFVSKTTLAEYIFIPQLGFLRRFRDPIRIPRISNRVPRHRKNYDQVHKIRENRVPRIREIGSLQIHTRYLTSSSKKTLPTTNLFSKWFSYAKKSLA